MNAKEFLENFGHLADASDGISKLRQTILQLAMQGKLVEEKPNEETSDYSCRILSEIQSHHPSNRKFGGRKKKGEPPLDLLNCPPVFRTPSSWCWAYLDFICEQIGDVDHKMPKAVESGVPFVSAKDLRDDGSIDIKNAKRISEADYSRLARKIQIQIGDIIYSRIGTIGKARLVASDQRFIISYSCCLIRPLTKFVDKKYLTMFLESSVALNQAASAVKGIGVPDLGLGEIKEFHVPLPPLAEQKRIVAKVDELMALCDGLEAKQQERRAVHVRVNTAALDSLSTAETGTEFDNAWSRVRSNFDLLYSVPENVNDLRQTILQLAVQGKLVEQDPNDESVTNLLTRLKGTQPNGNKIEEGRDIVTDNTIPHQIPKTWAWARLSNFGDFVGGGTPSKQKPMFWQGQIPWVSPKDMKKSYIGDSKDHISQEAVEQSSTKLIPAPSLLVVVRGMILSHSFPAAITTNTVTINQDMKAIQLQVPEISDYLLNAVRAGTKRILTLVKRSSHGTCRMPTNELENVLIPLPPLAEQKRIVAKVDELMALCDDLEAKLMQQQGDADRLTEAMVAAVLDNAAA